MKKNQAPDYRGSRRQEVMALTMLYRLMENFPMPFGKTRWTMRVPELPKDISIYQHKRRTRERQQKRVHQSHCRVVGGNHRQNFRRAERNYAFQRELHLDQINRRYSEL
jgi:hypothetical protein